MPAAEKVLLMGLVKHILKADFTEAIFELIMAARCMVVDVSEDLLLKSALSVEDKSGVLDDIMEDEQLVKELQDFKATIKAAKARQGRKLAEFLEVPLLALVVPAAPLVPPKPAFLLKADGYEGAAVRPYLPPGVRISKEKVWRHVWKMEGEYLEEKSRKFNIDIEGEDWAALVTCMHLCWAA